MPKFLTEAEYKKTAAAKRGVPYSKYVPWWQTQQRNQSQNATVKQAKGMAGAALSPELAALEAERARTDQQFGSSANTLKAAYAALAEVQKGLAPGIRETYDQAEGATSSFAKGFSSAFQAASEGSAKDINEFLQKQGSPQQVKPAGEAGADVLYGLGGFIPASTLNREGAAFETAAKALPGTTAGLGMDALKGLDQQRLEALRGLTQTRLGIEAKRPSLVNQFLNQIQESRRADRALDINEEYLNNTVSKTQADMTGYYVGADGQMYPTADTQASAGAAAGKKADKRGKAVEKRNTATVKALDSATNIVEKAVKTGTARDVTGNIPVKGPSLNIKGVGAVPQYWTKDGKLTRNAQDPNILTKPVYQTVPLPKPQYDRIYKQVLAHLRRQLSRFGYKPAALRAMAADIMGDYYTLAERHPATPNLPGQEDSTDRRGGR